MSYNEWGQWQDDEQALQGGGDNWFDQNPPPAQRAAPQAQAPQQSDADIVRGLNQNAGVLGSTNNMASDTAALSGKNPEDRAKFIADLTAQINGSASNKAGGANSYQGQASGSSVGGAPNFIQPFQGSYTNPTAEEARATPGYQFQLEEGIRALDRGAASKGKLLGGGQMASLQRYGQGLADSTYGETDARNFRNYADTKDTFFQNEANRFNSQRTNRMDDYSILSGDRNYGLAAQGQQFNQGLAQRGQDFDIYNTTDQNYYNRLFGLAGLGNPGAPNSAQFGANASDLITGGANATAAGQIGSNNAYNGALGSLSSDALAAYFNSRKPQGY